MIYFIKFSIKFRKDIKKEKGKLTGQAVLNVEGLVSTTIRTAHGWYQPSRWSVSIVIGTSLVMTLSKFFGLLAARAILPPHTNVGVCRVGIGLGGMKTTTF
jgi:hypothetical protein